jgi:hypothetical protein
MGVNWEESKSGYKNVDGLITPPVLKKSLNGPSPSTELFKRRLNNNYLSSETRSALTPMSVSARSQLSLSFSRKHVTDRVQDNDDDALLFPIFNSTDPLRTVRAPLHVLPVIRRGARAPPWVMTVGWVSGSARVECTLETCLREFAFYKKVLAHTRLRFFLELWSPFAIFIPLMTPDK